MRSRHGPVRAIGSDASVREHGDGRMKSWRARQESNLRPLASEANTLSPERRALNRRFYLDSPDAPRGAARPAVRETRGAGRPGTIVDFHQSGPGGARRTRAP